jgi:hypothetical protein
MTFLHEAWRRRVSLLASGVLDGADEATTLAHVEACLDCRAELRSLRGVLDLLARDPVRHAAPGVSVQSLLARVDAQLDREQTAPPARAPWAFGRLSPWWSALAAAAAVVALVALPRQPRSPGPVAHPSPGSVEKAATLPESTTVSGEVLDRLEGHVARQHAARYLSEAQDVLVTVAATSRDCERDGGRVDVGDQARRSRDLLARRTLLVEMDRDEVASVRPVLEDVEEMLREVAALESCARRGDLEAIHREMTRRHLLMKIDLMAGELLG